jgi:flagellar motor switch/type III secretory pathway protein FliN
VLPANFDEAEAAQEGGGHRLAALWLSLRLGGSMEAAQVGGGTAGSTWTRFRDQLLTAASAAVPEWPEDLDHLAVLVTVGSGSAAVEDVIVLRAPARVPAPLLPADPALAERLAGLPMRISVELASVEMSLHALLPLHQGQVLAIQPVREMRLRLGDHGIGSATLEPLPDGRQAATLLKIDVERVGERT